MSRLELLFILLRILTVILCRSSRGIPIINAACCLHRSSTRNKRKTRGTKGGQGEGMKEEGGGREERSKDEARPKALLKNCLFFLRRNYFSAGRCISPVCDATSEQNGVRCHRRHHRRRRRRRRHRHRSRMRAPTSGRGILQFVSIERKEKTRSSPKYLHIFVSFPFHKSLFRRYTSIYY